ncbi:MAG: acyloxyacyl hydrolase [Bacteroidetes bacterium HGW-Bacteroidetes-15]|nr:MAG: acyloxyacyl hydrolase [Bacteroidetes bacterium HGW-Bacteroidetes-15]
MLRLLKRYRTNKILFIVLIYFTGFRSYGNEVESDRTPYLGVRSAYGFIIAHSREIASIAKTNPWGVEIDFGWHHTSEKTWRYCFCYPRSGFMLSYFNFNNPEVLGNGYAIVPYIEPYLTADKPFSISIKAGLGLVYLDNVYHPVTNPENNFYSTPISFIALLNFGINYRATPNLNIKISGNYNHISNGSVKQPNKGINFPMASIGADYSFGSTSFPEREKEDYGNEKRHGSIFRISTFLSLKEISKEDKKQYPVFGFSGKYSYLVGRMSALTTGLEWVWDGSLKEYIAQNEIPNSSPNRFSVTAGHELLIGNVNFYQELGVYLYSPFEALDPVYQRYGIEYFLSNKISVGMTLKAHRHVADFMDIRVTISI